MNDPNPTEIHLRWHVTPNVRLSITCNRAVTSQELHHLAEVVEKIEEFRANVQGVEEALEA